jgi:hypothetical protein
MTSTSLLALGAVGGAVATGIGTLTLLRWRASLRDTSTRPALPRNTADQQFARLRREYDALLALKPDEPNPTRTFGLEHELSLEGERRVDSFVARVDRNWPETLAGD